MASSIANASYSSWVLVISSGRPIAFQVDFTKDGLTTSQRIDFPTAGGWRIKPKRKTRQSKLGYKSRKSKRRTFR